MYLLIRTLSFTHPAAGQWRRLPEEAFPIPKPGKPSEKSRPPRSEEQELGAVIQAAGGGG